MFPAIAAQVRKADSVKGSPIELRELKLVNI
jgi:hypothetical protein